MEYIFLFIYTTNGVDIKVIFEILLKRFGGNFEINITLQGD